MLCDVLRCLLCEQCPLASLYLHTGLNQGHPEHKLISAWQGSQSPLLPSRHLPPSREEESSAYNHRQICIQTVSKCVYHILQLTVLTAILGAIFSLISISLSEKSCRSSVAMMDSTGVPKTCTPYFCRTPLWKSSTPGTMYRNMMYHQSILSVLLNLVKCDTGCSPQLRAVCPPMESRIPSGRSILITSVTNSGVTGRKYTESACLVPTSLVCTEAMLGLISTVRRFSSCRQKQQTLRWVRTPVLLFQLGQWFSNCSTQNDKKKQYRI